MNTEKTSSPPTLCGLRIGEMRGGTGGKGGNSSGVNGKGGLGGKGGEALINNHSSSSNIEIDSFEGGTGGEGGAGTVAGGGGEGGRAKIESEEGTLLPRTRLPGPNMTIQQLAVKNDLGDKIVDQLRDRGYETAGSVRFATAEHLKADGFKQGQINRLKHALDMWSPKN
ncbi:hypothetical protein AX14_006477 [Amanita brunnescens Koide BX004]|nr:hypothetical protein AX14_006477 [Amanita brunnescens Koide BX004]